MTLQEQKSEQNPHESALHANQLAREATEELRQARRMYEELLKIDGSIESEGAAEELRPFYYIEPHTIFFDAHVTRATLSRVFIEPEEVLYIGPHEATRPAFAGESGFLLRFRAYIPGADGDRSYVMWLSMITREGQHVEQPVSIWNPPETMEDNWSEEDMAQAS